MSAPKKRLGRGLDALLSGGVKSVAPSEAQGPSTQSVDEMPVTALQPGRYQPRLTLAEDSLAELANSIREQGVLQPLVVRPVANATTKEITHEIVAGERRWRAAQLAGLAVVPVMVRDLDDQSALAVALIENLQREDLNPIEQAQSLSRLAEEFSLTHQQVADAVGRSRSGVSNLLRLLELSAEVRELLALGKLDMGHARALLPLPLAQQIKVAQRVVRSGWSVRQVEEKVRHLQEQQDKPALGKTTDLQTRWLQEQLAKELGGKVMLKRRKDGSYKLDVAFADLDELQGALGRVQELIGQLNDTAGPRVRGAASS
ncbi:MAG: ParB/RepB/Spo0J family partition protein [Woeseia sp.]